MGTLISANEHRTILGDLLLVKETMGCGDISASLYSSWFISSL
jgi:hypothetical protein